MVKLSSRYDSTLKKKVFILKGDEAYARTTEVIANLITFDDFDNHINYCHVGLEIEVLRELGDSYLYIYNNDEMLYDLPIPYNDSGMAEIIDSEWNEKGVYWIDNKLVIGKKSENPLVNTGLYLPYDVENKIRVEYIGNKHCLSSESKPIPLIVPTPDTFESTLTLWSDDPSYSPSATVNDVQLLFECENETENSKTVKIYDNDNLVTTETVMQDVPVTLTLSELSDGLHILKAVFEGDDEAYASETSYSISVGYKITNLVYPSYVVQGNAGTLSCKVTDYLDVALDGYIRLEEYDGSTWTEIASQVEAGSDGSVTFTNVTYSNNPFAVTVGHWHDTQHTMNIINPTSISLNLGSPYATMGSNTSITGGIYSNGSIIPISGITVSFVATYLDGTEYEWETKTKSDYTYSTSFQSNTDGKITITGYIKNTSVTASADWNVLRYWWSSSENKQYGNAVTNGVSITKKNNGFKFNNPNNTNGTATFSYGSGKWVTEFDMTGIDTIDATIGISTFNGLEWADEEYVGYFPFHMRIEHDADNTMRWYADNELVETSTNNTRAFVIGFLTDGNVIINNLKIERIQ